MKRKALLLIIPFAAAGLAGCQKANPPGPTPDPQCESATVSITSAGGVTTIKPGDTLQLTANVNIPGCTFSWVSNDPTIATVDENGKVTAVKEGNVTIVYGSGSFNLKVDNEAPTPPPVVEGNVYLFNNTFGEVKNFSGIDEEGFLGTLVTQGEDIIKGYQDATNAYIGGNGGNEADGSNWTLLNCLKVGKSKNKGSITLKLDSSIAFSSIKVKAIGSRDDGELTINGVTKAVAKKAVKDDLEPVEVEFEVSSGASELVICNKDDNSGNFAIMITSIEFVKGDTPTPTKEVKSIEITGTATKTSYYEGDAYSAAGLSVVATYTDDTTGTVSATITPNKAKAELGDTSVTFSATFGGQSATKDVTVTVSPVVPSSMKDAYEAGEKATSGESAKFTFSGVVVGKRTNASNVEFAIQDGDYGIDIFNPSDTSALVLGKKVTVSSTLKNYKGLVETGTIESIVAAGDGVMPQPVVVDSKATLDSLKTNVLVNASGTFVSKSSSKSGDVTVVLNAGSSEVNVFVKSSLVSKYSFLDSLTAGDAITIENAIVTAYNANQIGIYDDTVFQKGQPTPQKEVKSIAIAGEATKTSYYVGDAYSSAGLSVVATYTDDTTGTVSAAITPNKENAELGDTSVTFSATFGGKTATKDVAVTVEEAPADPVVGKTFKKISSVSEIEEGTYLIGSNGRIFNGTDGKSDYVTAEISDDSFVGLEGMAGIEVKEMECGYSLKVLTGEKAGKYIGGTSGSNTINYQDSAVLNTIEFNDGNVSIVSNTSILKFNANDGEARFRYYKPASQATFEGVQLFKQGETKKVESVAISGSLTKPTQYVGDTFDPSGLTVTAMYEGGETAVVTDKATWSVGELTAANPALEVTASFGGETSNAITVAVEAVSLTSMEIVVDSETVKKNYVVGDAWSSQGISVKGHYNNGSEATLNAEDYELSYKPIAPAMGVTEVEVTATHKTADLTPATTTIKDIVVTAEAQPELDSIVVKTNPTKMTYNEGESFDPAGLVITASYTLDKASDDKAWGTDGLTYSYAGPLKAPTATVTISYTEGGVTKSTTITITVTSSAEKGEEGNPYTATEAAAECAKLGKNSWSSKRVYVTGTVKSFDSSKNNNCTITDGVTEFIVYKSSLESKTEMLYKGDTVVFEGFLENYNGNTPEMTSLNDGTHNALPTLVSFTRGTSAISLDAGSSANADVTLNGTSDTNGATHVVNVVAKSGYEIVSVTANNVDCTNTEGSSYSFIVSGPTSIKVTTKDAGTADPEVYKEMAFTIANCTTPTASYVDAAVYKNNGFEITAQNFNTNAQKGVATWDLIKCGRKNAGNESVAYIANTSAIDEEIVSITITFDTCNTTALNEAYILVANNKSMTGAEKVSFEVSGGSSVTVQIPAEKIIDDGFYQIVFDCGVGSANGYIAVSAVAYNYIPE